MARPDAGSRPLAPDLSFCRAEFPGLLKRVNGHPVIFLDGPGGTQVPRRVVDRVVRYLIEENANVDAPYETSQATDQVIADGRRAAADFLGAEPGEIAFGQNMTTLNFALSRALARRLGPGDEVVITELDHEGNRGPWLCLEEKGVTVRQVRVDTGTCTLDWSDLEAKVTPRTRVLAIGGASNGVGTVNDVKAAVRLAQAVGAVSVIDAVHLAPHKPIDVKDMGCDYLLCSAYKFFGPHLGLLYGRREAFERLETYRLRLQQGAPFHIETGTLVHENIAGTIEAIEFVASLGRRVGGVGDSAPAGRRRAVVAGMEAIDAYERQLAAWFMAELRRIPGLRIYGPPEGHPRTPTISIRVGTLPPDPMSEFLAGEGVFAPAGDFYATTLMERLGLEPTGGVLRMGLAPYTTRGELERTLELIAGYRRAT